MRFIKVIAIVLTFCLLITACATSQTGVNRKLSNKGQQSTVLESIDDSSVNNYISSQQLANSSKTSNQMSSQQLANSSKTSNQMSSQQTANSSMTSNQTSNQISSQQTANSSMTSNQTSNQMPSQLISSMPSQLQNSSDTGVASQTSNPYSEMSSVLSGASSQGAPSSTASVPTSSATSSIEVVYPADKAHFTIIDDDGKDDVYTVLMPLLNNRGIKFSTSVITSKLNKSGNMTTQQLKEVVAAGNKVMSHGKTHVNLKKGVTTYEERYDEIVGSRQALVELGFDVDVMVYPEGAYNDEIIDITKSAYKYGIATAGDTVGTAQRYNVEVNRYAIKRVGIGAYFSGETAEQRAQVLAKAKENIDVCIENNYLCVIMTHIGNTDKDGVAQIVELIDYIESKGYKIEDFDTAIAGYIPPEER